MPTLLQFEANFSQLHPHPLRCRPPHKEKLALPRLPADVREAKEVEGLRLPLAELDTLHGGEPPEPEQARLVGVQFQRKHPQSLAEFYEEPRGVRLPLESDQEIIGKSLLLRRKAFPSSSSCRFIPAH